MPDELFEIAQGIFPLVDRHFIAVMRKPPILAITALVIAPFDHFAIDRHRHGHVAAGAQINFFGHGVACVVGAEPRQLQDVHKNDLLRGMGIPRHESPTCSTQ